MYFVDFVDMYVEKGIVNMQAIICDKCDERIADNQIYFSIQQRLSPMVHVGGRRRATPLYNPNNILTKDFCKDCLRRFLNEA